MLELEVVPERSLGCEHWEFILGKVVSLEIQQIVVSFQNLITKKCLTGMPFSQAVCICVSQVAVMKKAQVIYNENVIMHDLNFQRMVDDYLFSRTL